MSSEVDGGVLGIDIGGTKVAISRGGTDAPHTFRWPSEGDPERDLAELAGAVTAARLDRGATAVGVSVPATLDARGRVVAWPNRPSWVGLDLTAAVRGLFPDAVVRCADDGDLAALAEADHAGCARLLYLGVGTGIGGGLVVDGRPFPGAEHGSCEVGHVVVDRDGPPCTCGRRGCVQALAAGPATLRRAAELAGRPVDPVALRHAWAERREWAVTAVDEGCAALAAVVVSLVEVARPVLVCVGGGFADALPGYPALVARHVEALARTGSPSVPVRPAAFGGLSSLRGALLLASAGAPAQSDTEASSARAASR